MRFKLVMLLLALPCFCQCQFRVLATPSWVAWDSTSAAVELYLCPDVTGNGYFGYGIQPGDKMINSNDGTWEIIGISYASFSEARVFVKRLDSGAAGLGSAVCMIYRPKENGAIPRYPIQITNCAKWEELVMLDMRILVHNEFLKLKLK